MVFPFTAYREVNPINRERLLAEIEKRIRDLEKSGRILKRMYFVKFRYQGKGVEEAAKMVGVTKKLGYLWQDRWNGEGFNGLVPRFGGGRPPLMNNEERKSLFYARNEGLLVNQGGKDADRGEVRSGIFDVTREGIVEADGNEVQGGLLT
ncbi:MAG: helix-turn-helix domain-containing protein [Candidatus Micrarchaeaceae archaeon]